jgi:ferredoxin
MKIPKVDHELCTGDQFCIIIAPGVFEIDENGQAHVIDFENGDIETVQKAIDQCPSQAISWIEKE